jgi:hypothetical protein
MTTLLIAFATVALLGILITRYRRHLNEKARVITAHRGESVVLQVAIRGGKSVVEFSGSLGAIRHEPSGEIVEFIPETSDLPGSEWFLDKDGVRLEDIRAMAARDRLYSWWGGSVRSD